MIALFAAIDANLGMPIGLRPVMLILAIVVGTVLVKYERKAARPVIPVDLLARPLLALSMIGALIAFVASMAVLVLLPFRLGALYGFHTPEIGLAMSVWPLTALIVSPTVGVLSDRIPAWIFGTFGMLLAGTGLALLAHLDHASPAAIAWRLSLCGAGFACYMASNVRLVLANAPADRAASVGSLISTVRLTGQSLGAILAGAVMAMGWTSSPFALMIPVGLVAIVALCSISRKIEMPTYSSAVE
jgi:DHA2 family multidrug resistance protein-like MFS transporter